MGFWERGPVDIAYLRELKGYAEHRDKQVPSFENAPMVPVCSQKLIEVVDLAIKAKLTEVEAKNSTEEKVEATDKRVPSNYKPCCQEFDRYTNRVSIRYEWWLIGGWVIICNGASIPMSFCPHCGKRLRGALKKERGS